MSEATKKTILDRLNSGEVIIGDGGYITELERRGYSTAGLWTPEASVEHPEVVEGLHREFARSGSDILQAFTFYGSEDHIEQKHKDTTADLINTASCKIVKKVCEQTGCLWAGGLSPCTLYPQGASKKQVQDFFRGQCKIFVDENADFVIAEYFQFCEEMEWAVEILKETGKPVAASMCIDSTSDSKGIPTHQCAVRLVKAGADIVGINCKFDPQESLKAISKMKEGLQKAGLRPHLMLQTVGFHCPDATGEHGYLGLPEYPFALEPRTLTRWDVHRITRSAYDLGVRFIGGCCGYKPYHIRAIAEELAKERGRLPESSKKHKPSEICEFYLGDTIGVRQKDHWMNLKSYTG